MHRRSCLKIGNSTSLSGFLLCLEYLAYIKRMRQCPKRRCLLCRPSCGTSLACASICIWRRVSSRRGKSVCWLRCAIVDRNQHFKLGFGGCPIALAFFYLPETSSNGRCWFGGGLHILLAYTFGTPTSKVLVFLGISISRLGCDMQNQMATFQIPFFSNKRVLYIETGSRIIHEIQNLGEFYRMFSDTQKESKARCVTGWIYMDWIHPAFRSKLFSAYIQIHIVEYLRNYSEIIQKEYGDQCVSWIAAHAEVMAKRGVACVVLLAECSHSASSKYPPAKHVGWGEARTPAFGDLEHTGVRVAHLHPTTLIHSRFNNPQPRILRQVKPFCVN